MSVNAWNSWVLGTLWCLCHLGCCGRCTGNLRMMKHIPRTGDTTGSRCRPASITPSDCLSFRSFSLIKELWTTSNTRRNRHCTLLPATSSPINTIHTASKQNPQMLSARKNKITQFPSPVPLYPCSHCVARTACDSSAQLCTYLRLTSCDLDRENKRASRKRKSELSQPFFLPLRPAVADYVVIFFIIFRFWGSAVPELTPSVLLLGFICFVNLFVTHRLSWNDRKLQCLWGIRFTTVMYDKNTRGKYLVFVCLPAFVLRRELSWWHLQWLTDNS